MMTLKQLPPASGLITRWSGPLGDIFRLQRQIEVTEVEQKNGESQITTGATCDFTTYQFCFKPVYNSQNDLEKKTKIR